MFRRLLCIFTFVIFGFGAQSAELVLVEQQGCFYCEKWNEEIAEIYPKTAEGRAAPLRRIDLFEPHPSDLKFDQSVRFTPTFVLVENGIELARIEGYPGEAFFWGLLEVMLKKHTDFGGQS